ncbi:MAG: hypothetical protein V4563_02400 [Pseudomonadota bacterium]
MKNITLTKIFVFFIGVVVVTILSRFLMFEYVTSTVEGQFTNVISSIQSQAARSAEAAQQNQLAVERERTRQKELELAATQERIKVQQDAAQLAKAKELAWNKYYKRPKKCEDLSTNDVLIECGNYHIREEKKFEAVWEQEHQTLAQ